MSDFEGELLEVAREQLRWQKASVLPQVRQTIADTLTTTKLRRAYEMCDGETGSTEIAKASGVSKQAVSNWTRRWRDLGIAYETESRRIQHLTSLAALGLPVEVDET